MRNDENRRNDEQRLRVLQHVDATFRDQIRHADQKASLIIAVVAGLFTVSRDAVGVFREVMWGATPDRWTASLTAAFFASLFAALAFAFGAIVPRVDRRVATIFFWGTWLAPDATIREIEQKLEGAEYPTQELLMDIQLLAKIIARKLRWLRASLLCLGGSLTSLGLVAALKVMLR